MILKTKAETLSELKGKLSNAEVLPVFLIKAKEWKEDKKKIIKKFLMNLLQVINLLFVVQP